MLPFLPQVAHAAHRAARRRLHLHRRPEDCSLRDALGDDATALELMRHGAKGNVSVTANIAAAQVAAVCRLALAGDFPGAAAVNSQLSALNDALFLESNPVPVKWAMAELGMVQEGIRLPLVTLSSDHHAALRAAMQQAGL